MFQILNVYGPYTRRKPFWEMVFANGILNDPHLILVGDLNLTLCSDEVWGNGRTMDPLVDFFIGIFDEAGLVDVVPHCLYPTWSNGLSGSGYIGKHLDRFILVESLCEHLGKF